MLPDCFPEWSYPFIVLHTLSELLLTSAKAGCFPFFSPCQSNRFEALYFTLRTIYQFGLELFVYFLSSFPLAAHLGPEARLILNIYEMQ